MKNFLFIAAENDALYDCKVGGVADVIRDVPREIAKKGDKVHVIVPSYSRLHQTGTLICHLNFTLRGEPYVAYLYKVIPKENHENISHYVIHHPEIQGGDIGNIYHHDLKEPFYSDTIKYFIFCTAVAQAIKQLEFGELDIVHLHDWHTSTLLLLKRYHKDYSDLNAIKFVFCIHNLAIQGIRPFENSFSSLKTWFPDLPYRVLDLRDPRYHNCFNLMAIGIRFADVVHTVSPSYKEDVLLPSEHPEFVGGEGLEKDLNQADKEGRFFGILNGSEYPVKNKVEMHPFYELIISTILVQLQQEVLKYKFDFLAHTAQKLLPYLQKKPEFICSSVARLTEQKFYFFKRSPEALIQILQELEKINGVYVLLGTGAPEYEHFLRKISYQHKSLIFINFQSEDIIDAIYREADLYFMPSLFEPCGISQMLAMRNGQPCLAHNTGGLKDTISNEKTGFTFTGSTYEEKVIDMVAVFEKVVKIFLYEKTSWKQIKKNAQEMRFTWEKSVKAYYDLLYKIPEKTVERASITYFWIPESGNGFLSECPVFRPIDFGPN
ncbi:MAG: glycogen/starch synthase [Gillisia sp.]|nr:glycogen/starch synthase [Gillisia sp.]